MGTDAFEGTIGTTAADSQPWWPTRPHPGAGAPDVVIILIDDLGFDATADSLHVGHLQGLMLMRWLQRAGLATPDRKLAPPAPPL